MESVYLFNRSDNGILEELLRVCNSGRDTAREQWSLQAELLVEPIGWDALWKLSKDFCKKFDVRFPCIAYVSVTSVDFEELTANADVLSVHHEAVTIPETVVDIPLVELWPTIKQREASVDAATTAEFIDLLRFFYENIWMPWDDQDGKTLLPKTVEERMSLWSDMHNGTIPNCVARSITQLRNSAIDAYKKLKNLDSSLCDGVLDDDDDSLLPPSYITECAEMNARLDSLMSKWTLYENPLIREQYLAKTKYKWQKTRSKRHAVALWQGGSISEFNEITKFLSNHLTDDHELTVMASAEDGLSLEPDEVVVCSPMYELPEMPLSHISICSFNGSTLKATDMRSCLLMLSEKCRLQNLTLHCSQVNTIIIMLMGNLHIKNSMLADVSNNSQRDLAQGIVAKAGAKIVIEDCTFENFYSGIVVHKGAQVVLKQCLLNDCGVAIQMYSGSRVTLDGTVIKNCSEHCIRYEMYDDDCGKTDESEDLQIMPNCEIGSGNLKKEVFTVKHEVKLF